MHYLKVHLIALHRASLVAFGLGSLTAVALGLILPVVLWTPQLRGPSAQVDSTLFVIAFCSGLAALLSARPDAIPEMRSPRRVRTARVAATAAFAILICLAIELAVMLTGIRTAGVSSQAFLLLSGLVYTLSITGLQPVALTGLAGYLGATMLIGVAPDGTAHSWALLLAPEPTTTTWIAGITGLGLLAWGASRTRSKA